MSYVCEKCPDGVEFATRAEYVAHKAAHTRGEVGGRLEAAVGSEIEAEPIVIKEAPLGKVPPTATGEQLKKQAPWSQELDKRKKLGINLEYKYTGYCNECGSEVETLLIDDVLEDKQKQVVVGWCGHCKKKLRQRQVVKL